MPRSTSANSDSQNSRRFCGSTALVGSSRNSSSGSWISEAASARRWRWPPESVPARWSRAGRGGTRASSASTRCAPARGRQRVDLAHEVEVLAHGELFVEREALGHVADLAAQLVRVARDRGSPSTRASPALGAAGRIACGSWWSCPSRSGRGSRRCCARGIARSTRSTATRSPKRRVRPCASIASSLIVLAVAVGTSST